MIKININIIKEYKAKIRRIYQIYQKIPSIKIKKIYNHQYLKQDEFIFKIKFYSLYYINSFLFYLFFNYVI
jgi:hypothetical protein